MANLNAIDKAAVGNYRALSHCSNYTDFRGRNSVYCIRESEPDYTYDNANAPGAKTKLHTGNSESAADCTESAIDDCSANLSEQSLWPQFPDGAYLNTKQAAGLYRAAQGISGLVFVLNRSSHLRGLARDYQNEPDLSLSEVQESKVWSALIKLSADLNNLADDLQIRAAENFR